MADETMPTKYNEVLCIGLGLAGVCLGVQLKRKFGFTDIHFYDKNETHSGTWCANRYPGCACDIPAWFYSFSFEKNLEWSKPMPSRDEIWQYLDGVVEKYQLRPHMTFRTECETAQWDSKRQVWTVYLRDLATGAQYTHECRLLFSAVGVFSIPRDVDIPGWESFKGPLFHTAKWRSDVDLTGKDVIVVGNGCSAAQLVPEITPITKSLTQFINTPHWIVPARNLGFGPRMRWVLRNIPLAALFLRFVLFVTLELQWPMFKITKSGARMRRAIEKISTDYVRDAAPEKFQDLLIPDWELACRRRIIDSNSAYMKNLHAQNMHLTNDKILEIVPHGVRTATKTYPANAIVLATGFHMGVLGRWPMRVQGRNGEWLDEHWAKMGGPGAYNCTAIHGFPNFLMLLGPNSVTGHTSAILAIENMVNYALKVIKPVLKGEATEVEINSKAEMDYIRSLQATTSGMIWNTCHTWYVNNGWNSTVYPWSQWHFLYRSIFPTWKDWSFKFTAKRTKQLPVFTLTFFLLLCLTIAGVGASSNASPWFSSIVSDGYDWMQQVWGQLWL